MREHQVAFWAGISAFFGTVLAIGAIDILNPSDIVQFFGGVFVGLITGGAVYSKQRLDEVKAIGNGGTIVVREIGDKKVFSLEIDEDPDDLERMDKIVFKVRKEGKKE
jgi:hypothetical protein